MIVGPISEAPLVRRLSAVFAALMEMLDLSRVYAE
jgi:hypothetical protein